MKHNPRNVNSCAEIIVQFLCSERPFIVLNMVVHHAASQRAQVSISEFRWPCHEKEFLLYIVFISLFMWRQTKNNQVYYLLDNSHILAVKTRKSQPNETADWETLSRCGNRHLSLIAVVNGVLGCFFDTVLLRRACLHWTRRTFMTIPPAQLFLPPPLNMKYWLLRWDVGYEKFIRGP